MFYADEERLSPRLFVRCGAVQSATWDTMVTLAQVRLAVRQAKKDDEDDARSILHDIDTEWGALWEGGALEGYGSD